jgi:hypothetical protein
LPEPEENITSVKLYDLMGKLVLQDVVQAGQTNKTLNTGELVSGAYLLQVESEKGFIRKKVIITHDK